MWKKVNLCLVILLAVLSHEVLARKKVCVIGAGPSGLASIRQLAKWPGQFEPVAFEKNSQVGGNWIYSDSGDLDEHGLPVHSGVYKNLRTNMPIELMTYPDFFNVTFKESRSCVRHDTILDYLQKYARHFDLHRHIQFDTLVQKVTSFSHENDWPISKWRINAKNLNTNESFETICDAVMVCSGNLYNPRIPKIPGIEDFNGTILHSHSYRKPEDFAGQIVVVLGAGPSGVDIALELSRHAKLVYLSHRHKRMNLEWPANLLEVKGVVRADGNTLTLQDNSTIDVNSFVYCTGYDTVFPFLDESGGVEVTDNFVHPLYKQLVSVEHPTLAVLGLQVYVVSMALFDMQARYFISLLQGHVNLPTHAKMLASSALPPGIPPRRAHYMRHTQWAYLDDLARDGHIDNLPVFYERGFKLWAPLRETQRLGYKDVDLRILDDGRVVLVPRSTKV